MRFPAILVNRNEELALFFLVLPAVLLWIIIVFCGSVR